MESSRCLPVPVTDALAWTGRLDAIWTAPAAGAAMQRRASVVAGDNGLAGDRYAAGVGSFSRWPGEGRALTLIDAAVIADAEAAFGVRLQRGEHRRNLVVSGVPLTDLRDAPFRVGGVLLEGVRWCAPCKYLVRVTGQAAVFDALVGRGGLRARIVEGGTIRAGDAVVPAGPSRHRPLPG